MSALIVRIQIDDRFLLVSVENGHARPLTVDGDEWFGLAWGFNGTAARCRRLLAAPAAVTWLRHDGRPAYGLTTVPSSRSSERWRSPWTGERSPR